MLAYFKIQLKRRIIKNNSIIIKNKPNYNLSEELNQFQRRKSLRPTEKSG